jgi:hypothetical protein
MYLCIEQLDSLIGKTVEMIVLNVADQAGNAVPYPVTWSFPVADYGAAAASVHVSGLVLDTTFAAFQAKSGELVKIQQDLASALSIPLDRISNLQAFGALGGNMTALQFVIGAGTSKTAVAAAHELAQKLTNASPGLSGSLGSAVTSKVLLLSILIKVAKHYRGLIGRCA